MKILLKVYLLHIFGLFESTPSENILCILTKMKTKLFNGEYLENEYVSSLYRNVRQYFNWIELLPSESNYN